MKTKSLINKTAKAVRKEFAATMPKDATLIDIIWSLPTIAVNLPNGSEYFFQGEEAAGMLEAAVEASNEFQCNVEDVILFMSKSW